VERTSALYSQPENEFIRLHGFYEYSKWYLGIDDAQDEGIKVQGYRFPYRDSQKAIVAPFCQQKAAVDNRSTSMMDGSAHGYKAAD
jgi:hypothetical protein